VTGVTRRQRVLLPDRRARRVISPPGAPSQATLSRMALSRMALSRMALSRMALSRMALSRMALSEAAGLQDGNTRPRAVILAIRD
jgi:hypothetical protein